MAIASRTIERFAQGTAVPSVTIGRVARALREADGSLFPHDPVGRNKSTHLTPTHLVNLLIGVAAGDPITSAPRLVQAYRQAAYHQPIEQVLREAEGKPPILPGQSFGLDLESLVHLLAVPSEQERRIRHGFDGDFYVTLVVGEALVATVERPSLKQADQYDAKPFVSLAEREQRRPEITIQGRVRPVVPVRRIVRLELFHFEMAAELWADSLEHGAVYPLSPLDPSDDGSDENAAPGRAAPRRPRKRVVTADGLVRTHRHSNPPGEGETTVVLGHSQMGIPPFGDRDYENASNPAFA